MSLNDQPQFRKVEETYEEMKAGRERAEKVIGGPIPPSPNELRLKAEEDAAKQRRAG